MSFLCSEPTADGDYAFRVDSMATFDRLVEMERNSIDEADHWGGMRFSVSENDPDIMWDEGVDFENTPIIDAEMIDEVMVGYVEPKDEEYDEDLENRYRSLMDG